MLSNTSKLAKKNDTQPKMGGRGNVAPFPQHEFKIYLVSKSKLV
jgi:hypothetical protein